MRDPESTYRGEIRNIFYGNRHLPMLLWGGGEGGSVHLTFQHGSDWNEASAFITATGAPHSLRHGASALFYGPKRPRSFPYEPTVVTVVTVGFMLLVDDRGSRVIP